MEVKYVSPGKEVREQNRIEKIEGFKLEQPTGNFCTCMKCGTIFDTAVWPPGVLTIRTMKNETILYKQKYLLCRECTLRAVRCIEEGRSF